MKQNLFNNPQILAVFTNRFGGISQNPYQALNLATHVNDKNEDVLENRQILAKKLDFKIENLITMEQVHQNNIEVINPLSDKQISRCDGVITNVKNIPLMVMVADCIPILLYDPKSKSIGAVHAGRNGTFLKIIQKAILKMQTEFSSNPKDILISLGTAINQCCYEIDESLANITIKNFGKKYIEIREKKYYLNLQLLNLDQLLEMKIQKQNIQISQKCSCCDSNYFSYRREKITGRFAGVIMMKSLNSNLPTQKLL